MRTGGKEAGAGQRGEAPPMGMTDLIRHRLLEPRQHNLSDVTAVVLPSVVMTEPWRCARGCARDAARQRAGPGGMQRRGCRGPARGFCG